MSIEKTFKDSLSKNRFMFKLDMDEMIVNKIIKYSCQNKH